MPNKLSSQAGQANFAANEPTKEEIRGWDENEVVQWIQPKLSLKPKDVRKFIKAEINGRVFLRRAGDTNFFKEVGFSFGVSDDLAELAAETTGKKSTPLYIMDIIQTTSLQCHREQRTSRHYRCNHYLQKEIRACARAKRWHTTGKSKLRS
jgi:hypothetical protein